MIFDIENIGDDMGSYDPNSGVITIYLATIYHDFVKKHSLTEEHLISVISDTIHHEEIHDAIDDCLEGKPEEIDDHKIYKYLAEI